MYPVHVIFFFGRPSIETTKIIRTRRRSFPRAKEGERNHGKFRTKDSNNNNPTPTRTTTAVIERHSESRVASRDSNLPQLPYLDLTIEPKNHVRLIVGRQKKKRPQSRGLELVLDLHDAHRRAALLAVLRPILLAEVDGVAFVDRAALARHRKVCGRVPFYRLQPPDETTHFDLPRLMACQPKTHAKRGCYWKRWWWLFDGVAIGGVERATGGGGGDVSMHAVHHTQAQPFSG